VDLGADVNFTVNGVTTIQMAAYGRHVDAIKLLYKLGVDMKPNGSCIADIALCRRHSEAVLFIEKLLLKMTNECECCDSSPKRLKSLSKCRKVRYFTPECQKQDHKKHRQECKQHD
jgi:hypothetical protein